jgi:hypothetical protein
VKLFQRGRAMRVCSVLVDVVTELVAGSLRSLPADWSGSDMRPAVYLIGRARE